MVTWSDILTWQPDGLDTVVDDLNDRAAKLRTAADSLQDASDAIASKGETVSAAKAAITKSLNDTNTAVSLVSELSVATAQAATGVADVQTRVHECQSFAQINELDISAGGTASISDARMARINEAMMGNADVAVGLYWQAVQDRDNLQRQIDSAIERANEVDSTYAGRLDAVAHGEVSAEAADGFAQGLPDLPQEGWSDREVAAWWDSLTLEERETIIRDNPDAIGNLNGIDGTSRDLANRNRIGSMIEQSKADLAAAKENSSQYHYPGGSTDRRAMIDAAERRLADLEALNESIQGGGQLLLLDNTSSAQGLQAAVAVGNVDTASHVTTLVPGMTTNVRDSMGGLIVDSNRLRDIAVVEQGVNAEDIAVVSWIGYDAPPGLLESASTGRAQDGAGNLNAFVEGMHASRAYGDAGDPSMHVLGHSYGSTTSGMAMKDVNVGVVDNLVMFGSPGSGVQDVREYNLADQAYVSAVDSHDAVQGLGPDWAFGKNPTEVEGIDSLSSDDGVTDRPLFDRFARHSTYLKVPEGQTTTGILSDFAAVITGKK